MSIHIRVVSPVTTHDPRTLQSLRTLESAELILSLVEIEAGPPSIESEYDEAFAVPDTIRRIVEAERDGIDAVVIDCMGDPGLRAARERVTVPVLGPLEVALHTAVMLGEQFSFVTVLERIRPLVVRRARDYGVADRLASFRSIDLPVLQLDQDLADLSRRLCVESLRAVQEDHADVIVLGCTGFVGLADEIAHFVRAETGIAIPVIDPIPLAVGTAVAWVRSGLKHSKRSYPAPAPKPMTGYTRAD